MANTAASGSLQLLCKQAARVPALGSKHFKEQMLCAVDHVLAPISKNPQTLRLCYVKADEQIPHQLAFGSSILTAYAATPLTRQETRKHWSGFMARPGAHSSPPC